MPEFVLIIIVIIAALAGFLAGYLLKGIRAASGRTTGPFRTTPATHAPETPAQTETEADPTPISPATAATPAASTAAAAAATPAAATAATAATSAAASQSAVVADQPVTGPNPPPPAQSAVPADGFPVTHIAREVLEVADGIENPELARRLVEAVVLLPEVSAVRPVPGDEYQSLLHEWSGNRITDQQDQWYTIAETLAPGAITAEQRLLRPAHVIVYEPPEES